MKKMTRENNMKDYAKWCWIELTGFDNQKSGFGVKEYIDNAGFVPGLVSLLLSSADFVNQHDTAVKDKTFPPDICSYGGRPPCGEGKTQQSWTKQELKKLIAELQKHGVKVYFAVFDIFLDNTFHQEWVNQHREVLATLRNGDQMSSINPLARFKDGTYYEDFFAQKINEVIKDGGPVYGKCRDRTSERHLRENQQQQIPVGKKGRLDLAEPSPGMDNLLSETVGKICRHDCQGGTPRRKAGYLQYFLDPGPF
jgi:hypothetical protein